MGKKSNKIHIETAYKKLPHKIKWENKVWQLEFFGGVDKPFNYVNDGIPCFVDLFNEHCNKGVTLEKNINDLLERLTSLGLV